MNKQFLSIISLSAITILAVITGIFLINSIKKTYESPEFKVQIVSAAEAFQPDEDVVIEKTEEETPVVTKIEKNSVTFIPPKDNINYPSIKNKLVSWGYEKASNRKIDTVIIHSVYDALGEDHFDLAGVLKEFKDYGVASHYIVDRRGVIYRLVKEENIAYHAGVSQVPDGRTEVNKFSLGIELINDEDNQPTSSQYESLTKLIGAIKSKYGIKYILGHKDIAQGRKTDPWNFDWKKIK